ncbi:MAG: M48 family metalloprotease [Pseudomonadales bacterium]
MNIVTRAIALVCLCLFIVGCSVNPVTGKNEFTLVSASQEVSIGQKQYQPSQQSQGGRYIVDPNLQVYVRGVGKKLAAVSDRPDLPYEFVVLNNSVPNAWALPGGKIAINRGLLIHLDSEAELAAVLAHEIVHAAARHSAKQITRGKLLGAGSQALGIVLADTNYAKAANVVTQLGGAAFMARYGRSAELESDAYGMQYMARAGYDPYGAVKLQETFVKLSKGKSPDFLSGLFASHPPSQERVNANRELAKTLPKGNTFRARYQKKIAQLIHDKPAYKAEGEALKALKNKKPALALSHLDKAVKIQPNDAYFWELRGHAWKMKDHFSNAHKAYTTAIGKNPDLYSHHLARGILRYEHGDKQAAEVDLKRSNKLLPTQAASFLLGELAVTQNNTAQALQYYKSAAQAGGDVGQEALQKVARIEIPKAPHKYIASQPYVDKNGTLRIAIKNRSAVTVTDIEVHLSESSGYAYAYRVPETLKPGQQTAIPTAIKGLTSVDDARRYRARVVKARIAQ